MSIAAAPGNPLTDHDGAVPVIEARGVTKRFGRTVALNELSLTVRPGEIHGFLGPNGAGKSTLIRVLLGLLRLDAGEVRVLGADPWRDAVALHRRLAAVPGDVDLWPNLTGGEIIDTLLRVRGRADQTRRDELVERFQLDPRKKARTYSKGNRQKVALIAALAADVELLLLDEPTSGLDPLMEALFQRTVREAAARGTTVLLSSHILGQVEALSDRISIIRQGSIVESGTLDELRHMTHTRYEVVAASDFSALAGHPHVHGLQVEGERAVFDVDAQHTTDVLETLAALAPTSLTAQPPTLEQLLMRHYDRTES